MAILKLFICGVGFLSLIACGGSSPNPPPPAPPEPVSLTINFEGQAVKGLFLNALVRVVNLADETQILASTTTNAVTGRFALTVQNSQDFLGTYVKIIVSGGAGAQMVCDVFPSCSVGGDNVDFGEAFDIDANVKLSAVVARPAANATANVNITLYSELAARLVANTSLTAGSFMQAQRQALDMFFLDLPTSNSFSFVNLVESASLSAPTTSQEEAIVYGALFSAGVLSEILQNNEDIARGLDAFFTQIIEAEGIVSSELNNDNAIISFQEILDNAANILLNAPNVQERLGADFVSAFVLRVQLSQALPPDTISIALADRAPSFQFFLNDPAQVQTLSGQTLLDVFVITGDRDDYHLATFTASEGSMQIVVNRLDGTQPDTVLRDFEAVQFRTDITSLNQQVVFAPLILLATPSLEPVVFIYDSINTQTIVGLAEQEDILQINGIRAQYSFASIQGGVRVTANTGQSAVLYFVDTIRFSDGVDIAIATLIAPPPSEISISGRISFDFIPPLLTGDGLSYSNTEIRPVRGVIVRALDKANAVLAEATTNANGGYLFEVLPPNTDIRIQVRAQMRQTALAELNGSWDITVNDNTNENAVYTLLGALVNSGVENSNRDLHAPSGWGGSSYTGLRASAPFAILYPLYDMIKLFAQVDSDIVFPPLQMRWSVNNTTAVGNLEAGQIGSSFYSQGSVYILGAADNDTDENDGSVVVHEWGHYYEDMLSRSDSVGGIHEGTSRLEMNVAFSEGFGNALSGIGTGQSFYRDSLGFQQSGGFSIDLSVAETFNFGWYSESSAQAIIYNLFDENNSGSDTISGGLAPIHNALSSDAYTSMNVETSIYSFTDVVKQNNPELSAGIDSLLTAQNIFGRGSDGAGETNDGGTPSVLPVFKTIVINGLAMTVCSVIDNGVQNRLGNFAYLIVEIPTTGDYTFSMIEQDTGRPSTNPDIFVYQGGRIIDFGDSLVAGQEIQTFSLQAGYYWVRAFNFGNVVGRDEANACYDFTVSN